MKRTILPVLLFIGMSICPMFAQNKAFVNGGEEGFLPIIETMFGAVLEKKELKAYMTTVSAFWNAPETTSEQKQKMLAIADKIAAKKGRPIPDYQNYLRAVMTQANSDQTSESLATWHRGVETLLDQPKVPLRTVSQLLVHSANMVAEGIIYSTQAIQWRAEKPLFHFTFSDSLRAEFSRTRIICLTRRDSIWINGTAGVINLQNGVWCGDKGEVTWEQSGFSPAEINATFGEYRVNMSGTDFEVDDATFYNRNYFSYPLKGKLRHRVTTISNPETATYPRFVSSGERYNIKSIHPNFDYEGGFSQNGAKFLGSGTDSDPAIVSVYRADTLFITAQSLYFALRKDQIQSTNTEITIHLDTGYVYHPGLTFKYLDDIKEVHLIRDGEGLSTSLYFDTYHNVSIDAELIRWKVDAPEIEIRMIAGAADNYAFFESNGYFREEFYNQLQGMDAIHPLQGLLNCANALRSDKFTAHNYARFLGMPESSIRQQIIGLSFHGFVGYNVNTDTIEIRERLRDYLLFRAGRKDYDVIRFKSVTPGNVPNAVFDLRNYDITLNGVSTISISDHQNVAFFPKSEKLLLKRDRNFNFDGSIAAGMLRLYGSSFLFNYQNFRIDMRMIDSLAIRVETTETDYLGRPMLRKVENTVSQLSGFLEIDRNDNKSGKEKYPEYPRLTSTTKSYVYYNSDNIQGGAYDKENFHFTLDPFEIDSVNKLSEKNIAFTGELVSKIFPVIKETLVVREDFSLGFRRKSPPEGYPIYGGKGTFTSILDLSNKGLKGNGTLNYVSSTSNSEDFTFLPDKTVGTANINIAEQKSGVEFPDVQGTASFITFLPNENRLVSASSEEFFTMHNGENRFEGALSVTPQGLEGNGSLHMPKADLVARSMDLAHHTVMADSADFNLLSDNTSQDVNFKTNNLTASLDFEKKEGHFISHDLNNKVEFTENRYISYISEFSWEMVNNNISLGARGSKGNRFVSTHKAQDSLDFIASIAIYDVANRIIRAEEVKNIDVADVSMLLKDGKVTIRKDALMDPLDSVRIMLNDSLHQFYDARVSIESKKMYNASGSYDFVNGDNATKTIKFGEIAVNKEIKTTAKGTILENEMFTFNSHFGYKGDVNITSGVPLLRFHGGAQMMHPCSINGPQYYVRFDSEIDPQNVLIPVGNEVQNYDFDNIFKGFYLNRDSNEVYTSFFEDRRFHSDPLIMSSEGFLHYKDAESAFVLEPEIKMHNPDTIGTVLRYHETGCNVSADGAINLGLDFDHIKMPASGNGTHIRDTGEATFSGIFAFDFMLDPKSVETVVNTIRDADPAKTVNPETTATLQRLKEWTGLPEAVKIGHELTNIEKIKTLPADRQYTMVFDSLTWTWNKAARSYIAEGQANLLWMKDNPVSRKVHVKGKISFSRGGNTFDLYVEAKSGVFFLFSYRPGSMQTRSSLDEYNRNVVELKTEERTIKASGGVRQYVLAQAPDSRLKQVLRFFQTKNAADTEEPSENGDDTPEESEE
ncbi:MAG: hypothetical protein LBV41_12655 [Cytophagaceae bacterium]|jgi:hypothetical protein|nr:hypothetical protein [Cytophagaceae bacterium]